MREGKKSIDHSSIMPNEMWTIKFAGKKQVIYDIDIFTETVRNALQDIEAGRERIILLTPQEPIFDIKAIDVSAPTDPRYLYVEYVYSDSQSSLAEHPAAMDHLTVMDALSICTELFLKKDPRMDGE